MLRLALNGTTLFALNGIYRKQKGFALCSACAEPALSELKPSPFEHIKKRITNVILFLIVVGGT